MGRLSGRVAFITGAARGQGRTHAVRLAEEGADVAISDICAKVETNGVAAATSDDLAETVALVEKTGQRVIAREVDVRDIAGLTALADEAVSELGGIDVVVANAGILSWGNAWELSEEAWSELIDINLTGVFHTIKATVPHMIRAKKGGSIILTSSSGGPEGQPFTLAYTAAKHGVVGITRGLANELGEYDIRVNSIHPGGRAYRDDERRRPLPDDPVQGRHARADLHEHAAARVDEARGRLGRGRLPRQRRLALPHRRPDPRRSRHPQPLTPRRAGSMTATATSRIGNWGRWGDDDERGALNLLTPEVVLRAAQACRTGKVYNLGLPVQRAGVPVFDYRGAPQRLTLTSQTDEANFAVYGAPSGLGANEDVLVIAAHNGTHMDALCSRRTPTARCTTASTRTPSSPRTAPGTAASSRPAASRRGRCSPTSPATWASSASSRATRSAATRSRNALRRKGFRCSRAMRS